MTWSIKPGQVDILYTFPCFWGTMDIKLNNELQLDNYHDYLTHKMHCLAINRDIQFLFSYLLSSPSRVLYAFTAKSLVLETDGKQKPLCFIIHTNTFILLVFSLLCYTHHISTHQLPMLSVYKDIFCCKDGKSNKRGEITRDLFIQKLLGKNHSRK